MRIQSYVSGATETRRVRITGGVEYAKLWLAGASVDDLVRVSRLLKYMCLNQVTGDAYEWSVEQVRRISGYSDDMPGDYTGFEDALRDGLRKLSEESSKPKI